MRNTNHIILDRTCSAKEQLVEQLGPERYIIIRLERDPGDVVASLCALGCLPGVNAWGTHWLADPAWKETIFRVAPQNAYEAGAWHVYEVALRFERFRRKFTNCHIVYLQFEDLIDPVKCQRWLTNVGFNPGDQTAEVLARQANVKSAQKTHPVDRGEVRRAVDRYAALALQQIEGVI